MLLENGKYTIIVYDCCLLLSAVLSPFPGREVWEAYMEKSSEGCGEQSGGQPPCSGTENSKRTSW